MLASVRTRGGRGGIVLATSALLALTLSACARHVDVPLDVQPPQATATSPGPAIPRTSAGPGRTPTPDRTEVAGPATGREAAYPVRVRIPAIEVSARVVPLPLDAGGRLVAPKRYDVAGWNEAGPEPGETGTAVIAGHVDSRAGPAVFFRLRELRPGDRIHVDLADGSTATFSVTRVARYPKSGVPDEVYRPARDSQLRLITCGGSFDRDRRSYRDNVVAYPCA